MGKHEKKKSSTVGSKSGRNKFIAIGAGIAIAVAIGIGLAVSMGNNTPSGSDDSRTVPWIHVHGLGIDPSDPSVLYIATHGDFYKSVDGSVPVKVDKQRADYMAFNAPQAEGVPLYSSGHPSTGGNTGLIKSTDGGQTWQVVSTVLDPPVDFHAMAVSASDPDTIIGFDSGGRGLFKTTDAGSTWDKFDYPGDYVTALATAPNDPEVIFAGTPSGVFQSSDGAASWYPLNQYKVKEIIILNGHHGNMGALQYIAQELHGKLPRDARVHTIHYWHMMKSEFDHAGEVETSLVLAIAPELVRMDMAVPNSKKLSKSKAAYSSITNAPGSFPKITGNGVWGDPRKATAAKGEKWIQEIIAGLAKTIRELG